MAKEHHYKLELSWTGNLGSGTQSYTGYSREHEIRIEGKSELLLSSDPLFRGDAAKYNPEDLLLASIASCHMLWYLHLCADAGITVLAYQDLPEAVMVIRDDGGGHFKSASLKPKVTISDPSKMELALALHHQANQKCFIANSCKFPIEHFPECYVQDA